MAIIDTRNEFCAKQTVQANGYSTGTIDLGSDRNIGVGEPMYVVVQLGVDAGADQTVTLESCKTENGSYAGIGSLIIPNGSKAGVSFVLGVPFQNTRYLRLKFSATGTVTAYLTNNQPTQNTAYPAVN